MTTATPAQSYRSCMHSQQMSEAASTHTNGSSSPRNWCEYLPALPYARSRKGADRLHGLSSRESIEKAQICAGSLPSMAMCRVSLPGTREILFLS